MIRKIDLLCLLNGLNTEELSQGTLLLLRLLNTFFHHRVFLVDYLGWLLLHFLTFLDLLRINLVGLGVNFTSGNFLGYFVTHHLAEPADIIMLPKRGTQRMLLGII